MSGNSSSIFFGTSSIISTPIASHGNYASDRGRLYGCTRTALSVPSCRVTSCCSESSYRTPRDVSGGVSKRRNTVAPRPASICSGALRGVCRHWQKEGLSDSARRRAHEIAHDADLRMIAPRDFFTVGGERIRTTRGAGIAGNRTAACRCRAI